MTKRTKRAVAPVTFKCQVPAAAAHVTVTVERYFGLKQQGTDIRTDRTNRAGLTPAQAW